MVIYCRLYIAKLERVKSLVVAVFLFSFLLTACKTPAFLGARQGGKSESTSNGVFADNAVCDPFSHESSIGMDRGLKAELFYLNSNLQYNQVDQYIQNGTKVDATIFMNQLNVPTRPFDSGFTTTDGQLLKTPSGATLIEWFSIRFETVLRLSNADMMGRKQFALLSDDGAILRQKIGDDWVTVINNDGNHPTKFAVAPNPITMDGQSALDFRIDYYQGPRLHIAAVLLWREWPANDDFSDAQDGQAGNSMYFDSTVNPPLPQKAWNDLMDRGWRVVAPENFYLPNQSLLNPCGLDSATK